MAADASTGDDDGNDGGSIGGSNGTAPRDVTGSFDRDSGRDPDAETGSEVGSETGETEGGLDMTGASREEIADLVDHLEDKVLAERGDPEGKIAEEAAASGTDRADGEAEPPV